MLLIGLTLFLSNCKDKGSIKPTEAEIEINGYLEQVTKDTSQLDREKHVDAAIQLSKESNNPTLHYQSVLYKLDYCIAPVYQDSIPIYFDQILRLAAQTPNASASIAYTLTRKGDYAFAFKQYQNAYELYYESKGIFEKEKDSIRMGYNLLKMAEIQQIYTDYLGGEETITEALKVYEGMEEPNQEYIREAYNKLGISYAGLKNYKEAINSYNKAKEHTNNPEFKERIDNNIALCYLEDSKYDQAIKVLTALYESELIGKDSITLAKVTDNLGLAQFKRDGVSGKALMETALAFRTKQGDEKGLVYSYLNLSQYYKVKHPALATEYAQKAYTVATKVGALDHRLDALELLSTIGGKSYNHEYFRLNDSIDDFRLKAKNQFAKMRFDATDALNENLELKFKNLEARNRNLIGGMILGAFIIVLVFLYLRDKRKHKKEKREQQQENEYKTETRIAKKLHDELANDIFNTMTFAEIRDLSASENKEILLDRLDKIYAQTRNISKENSNIDTGVNYLRNLKEMLSGYGSQEVNIILREIESIDWQGIEASKKIVVYRVLQELLVNMKKHSKATLVVISFKKINKKIKINYSDNGVGMGPDEHLRKNGLQNVENRIQNINGTITFDTIPERGFKVNFLFNV